jgi:FkbM family methyltransferase
LPPDVDLTLADVGSIGGLHHRWRQLANHLITINFDPLDKRPGNSRALNLPVLLGDEEGEGILKVTRRASMSSILDPNADFYSPFWRKADDIVVTETIGARMDTLDAVMAREGLSPDALKVDVQGGEGAVLDGAKETLRRSVILAEIECSFAERYTGQRTFDEVMALMRENGFGLLDLRRLKRYRYRNSAGVDDPSLGHGMRAGRIAFCDAIFILEPGALWQRIEQGGNGNDRYLGLKAILLFLTYGKADLASATFDRCRESIPSPAREAFADFFASLKGDGGWRNRLHQRFDVWSRRV